MALREEPVPQRRWFWFSRAELRAMSPRELARIHRDASIWLNGEWLTAARYDTAFRAQQVDQLVQAVRQRNLYHDLRNQSWGSNADDW